MNKLKRENFIQELQRLAQSGSSDAVAIMDRVSKSDLQVVEHAIVVTKLVGGQNFFNLFETADPRIPSLTNISNAKPEADQMMLITGIQLLAITHTGAVDMPTLKTLNFGSVKAVTGLANGTITLKSGNKNILNVSPNWKFVKDGANQETGLFDVSGTFKWIYPNQEIEANIELGAQLPANTAIKLLIHGLATSK